MLHKKFLSAFQSRMERMHIRRETGLRCTNSPQSLLSSQTSHRLSGIHGPANILREGFFGICNSFLRVGFRDIKDLIPSLMRVRKQRRLFHYFDRCTAFDIWE